PGKAQHVAVAAKRPEKRQARRDHGNQQDSDNPGRSLHNVPFETLKTCLPLIIRLVGMRGSAAFARMRHRAGYAAGILANSATTIGAIDGASGNSIGSGATVSQ